ncbi:hypothetical protein CFP56_024194 [Quercus suber]|uniref:Protein FAR1-RELATED SEQUENCE n=1 Tax=Quercus suber TaxID=58331 RepID=A0AAW0K7N0_QUESU
MEEEKKIGSSHVELNENNIENATEETRNVKDKIEDPKVGMMFNSIDDIMKYYTRYGKEKGFAVAKRSSKKGDDGEVREVYRIPDKYILKRWSKTGIRSQNKVQISYDNWFVKPEAQRYDKMCKAFYEVANLAADSEDRCDKVTVPVPSSETMNAKHRSVPQ